MARSDGSAELEADRARALALTPVSRETAERLDRFVDLLRRWQRTTNLIGSSTLPTIWTRHISDSLQLLALAPAARTWIDFGAGAGFPGLVLACTLAETPGAAVHLVESNAKKAAFLREVRRLVAVPATVHAERMETFASRFRAPVEVVTARAVAPLKSLLELAFPLLSKDGVTGLFPKGQNAERELSDASACWLMTADLAPSLTDRSGRIVIIRDLERRGPAL